MLSIDCDDATVADAAVPTGAPPEVGGIDLTSLAGAERDEAGMSVAGNVGVSRGGGGKGSSADCSELGAPFLLLPVKNC